MEFRFDLTEITRGLKDLAEKTDKALEMYAGTQAKSIEGYAKKNASWTDRSGDARRRVGTKVSRRAEGFRIELAHGVLHGKYLEGTNNPNWSNGSPSAIDLEFAYEKKYAIIGPTIRAKAPDVLKGLEHLWERIRYG